MKENELKNTLSVLGKKAETGDYRQPGIWKKSVLIRRQILMLTSFSILFARYKGNLDTLVRGVTALDQIRDGDRILIAEDVRTTGSVMTSEQ